MKIATVSCCGALSLILISTAALATSPSERSWNYRVRVPKTTATCSEEAARAADLLKGATGVTIQAASCSGEFPLPTAGGTKILFTLNVTYLAQDRIMPYTALLSRSGGFSEPTPFRGFYANYDECVAAIPEQSATFEAQTGLTAVAAGCFPSEGSVSDPGYNLRIDGFKGAQSPAPAKRKLFFFEMPSYADPNALGDAVATILLNHGTHLLMSGAEGQFLYYAEAPLRVQIDQLGFFENKSQCEVQLEEARSIFLDSGAVNAIARCPDQAPYGLSVVHDSPTMIQNGFESDSPDYYSFEECMADKGRIFEESRSAGHHPVGVLCAQKSSGMTIRFGAFLFSLFH